MSVITGIAMMAFAYNAQAQTSRLLMWDEASAVTGFAVTVDDVRTDYGTAPLASDGTCGCAVAAWFIGARHIVVIRAYNAYGETSSPPFVVGPTANPGGPYQSQVNSAMTVSAAASVDQTSAIANYAWKWGDGSPDSASASVAASHTYSAAGTYTITLTVTDNDGATHSATTTAAITAPPSVPTSPSPPTGATSVGTNVTLTWSAGGATGYDVHFGTSNPPPLVVTNGANASYTPAPLANGTSYFWLVVARNSQGSTSGPVWSFTTAAAAPTTIALVQHAGKTVNTATTGSLAFSSATRPGDWIAVAIRTSVPNETFTVRDSSGNQYVRAAQSNVAGAAPNAYTLALFYAENIKGGPDTVTVSDTAISTLQFAILEYSGVATANSLDATAFQQGFSASPNTGTASTTASGKLLLGMFITANGANYTAGSGYTMAQRVPNTTNARLAVEHMAPSASGAASATASLGASDYWGALLVALRPAAASGLPSTPASPAPSSGATNASTSASLSWVAAEATSYDVRFGTTNPPPLVSAGQPAATYALATLANSTSYFWQIVARNTQGSTTGPVWTFTTAAAATSTGLVAAYGFSEGTGTATADSSGSGITGALVGSPSWTTGRDGSGLSFNGSTTYVDLGHPAALQLTGSMTVSAWVYETANVVDDGQIIAQSDGGSGWQLKSTPDTGTRTFGFAITDPSGAIVQRYSTTVRVLNTWYYVTGVYDAPAQTLHIYVNGVLDDGVLAGAVPSSQRSSSVNANIGRRTGGFNLQGIVDNVRIYSRTLTQSEVQTDMSAPVN
jgi:hypothetical protein